MRDVLKSVSGVKKENTRQCQDQASMTNVLVKPSVAAGQLLATVFDSLSNEIVILDLSGNILYANQAWKTLIKSDMQVFSKLQVGRNLKELSRLHVEMPENDLIRLCRDFEDFVSKKIKNYSIEFEHHEEQEGRTSRVSFSALETEAQSFVVLNLEDISLRKRALEDLQEKQNELETLLNAAPIYIWHKDVHNNLIRVNQAAAKAKQMPLDELEGRSMYELVSEAVADTFFQDDLEVIRTGKPKYDIIERMYPKQGGSRWIHTNKAPCFDLQGNVTGVIVASQDITDRIYAQTLLQNIIDITEEGFFVIDKDQGVVQANQSLLALLGFDQMDQVLGKSIQELFKSGLIQDNVDIFDLCEEKGFLKDQDLTFENNQGQCKHVVINAVLQYTDEGRRLSALCRDITQRKEAEQKLRSYASKLMIVEERERRRIATVLHDHVGQLLAMANLKLTALTQKAEAPSSDMLTSIQQLIQDANSYAKTLTVELSPPILYEVGLGAAIQWLLEKFQTESGISYQFKHDELDVLINNELRSLLYQAVKELLHNVVKHSQASRVAASLLRVDDAVEIKIEDDGIGFDTKKLKNYDDVSKGFGLFNIREHIYYLGGSMRICSKQGHGTTVYLHATL